MRIQALKKAFPLTIPVMAGYLFLGFTYGVYMHVSGFSFIYPMCMSVIIYGGSLEFVTTAMLLAPFAPLQTFFMALMIQARHLFYGIAMLDKYKNTGAKKFYLIYALSDETFSVCCNADVPKNIDKGWFYFWISLLDMFYWFAGATLGGLAGNLITINTKGLDFVMTAMFVTIFVDNWIKEKKHFSSVIGIAAAVICRLVFTADTFIIPTMIVIIIMLTVSGKFEQQKNLKKLNNTEKKELTQNDDN